MESTGNKSRTPSRCREWERQRRNKFNEAISKLGDIVKDMCKAQSAGKDTENVQYPKIDIIQKAILYLTNSVQENTQLKAEILALQVELDVIKNKVKKDASTQVLISVCKKSQNSKYSKSVKQQKPKQNALNKKPNLTTNQTIETNTLKQNPIHILPQLLPKTNVNSDKRSPENTIVVLPASPYIFPQRPLLFPTVPPAIVLVDSGLQTLNKFSNPVVNRNSGDVTKTTMVNILPISAYSRPLSATKIKKNPTKSKKENKKSIKSSKPTVKVNVPEENKESDAQTKDVTDNNIKDDTNKVSNNNSDTSIKANSCEEVKQDAEEKIGFSKNEISETNVKNDKMAVINKTSSQSNETGKIKQKNKDIIDCSKKKLGDVPDKKPTQCTTSKIEKPSSTILNSENSSKSNKTTSTEKVPLPIDKDKENKLPNILETTLCDTVVDAGNARLELAEEFLAASPTAAFLMSFPLVSGNRADSPADETHNIVQNNKDSNHRRNELTTQPAQYFNKDNTNETKPKPTNKIETPSTTLFKQSENIKYPENNLLTRQGENKTTVITTASNVSGDNPFLNLPMPSLVSTNNTISDTTFGLDFDCNINKSIQNQSTSYGSNSNFFYKSDPFNSVKNTIYSTSNISSSHDFNNLALYPCAMEKYSSKSKCDYPNVDESLMKIGSSRLTYDIDLGWSHKSFDFVNPTTSSNSFNKDNILNTVSAPYSSSYNPFNPEFHMPLVSSTAKKDNIACKTNTSFTDTITSFYSQTTNLWSDDVPFYTNSNTTKTTTTTKHQNYINVETLQPNIINSKPNDKQYETSTKQAPDTTTVNIMKTSNNHVEPQIPEKYTKKSPSKMHINWMTSEITHMENNCNTLPMEHKENHKTTYPQINHTIKKQDHNESYFPISMHNFTSQPTHEEFQMWPSTRTTGPTEITMEPPPLNLPTLVGDLALGPHDRKKNADITNRPPTQSQDIQNCGNFLSVTQLMNRSSDNMPSRYQVPTTESLKTGGTKHISSYFANDTSRKIMSSRMDSQLPQPCYGFNETKPPVAYDNVNQFSHSKNKANKSDKSSKAQKNSYSAEALIRGGGCTQKNPEINNVKFAMPSQKYHEFNTTQDSSVAQVSHFPPILDYSDNSYASQQFSGTTLYNATTNTISNSFYSNFMPTSSNLMSSNYTSGPFTGEYIDYNNQSECNYTNHKYEELKMRSNMTVFPHDKVPSSNYKAPRRESATKHKLECTKKDSSKKYQSKRAKLNSEVEEWNDPSHILWQNKAVSKRHGNLVSEDLPFPNYVSNQMPTQYQPDFFNSHLMPSNVHHNVDRSLSFPVTSRANFNLSTIFPEITMKVQ